MLLIGSCWLAVLPFAISGICWRGSHSLSTRTTRLTYALGKVDGWTAMQCQQLSFVAGFTLIFAIYLLWTTW
jgi:hypothetical protein